MDRARRVIRSQIVRNVDHGEDDSIMSKTVFREHVSEVVFGIDMFDLDFGILVDSVKEQSKRDSVASGHVSHCRTSTIDDLLDHCCDEKSKASKRESFAFEVT